MHGTPAVNQVGVITGARKLAEMAGKGMVAVGKVHVHHLLLLHQRIRAVIIIKSITAKSARQHTLLFTQQKIRHQIGQFLPAELMTDPGRFKDPDAHSVNSFRKRVEILV